MLDLKENIDYSKIYEGMFVELRSEDTAEKPWIAKITEIKYEMDLPSEVECEWLWHPKDYIRDYGLNNLDPNTYGSREVFLSGNRGDSAVDWNPVNSIKWEVYVFTLSEYQELVSSNYTYKQANSDSARILEPNRCWYYRQTINIDAKILTPPLENVIHRPSLKFQKWCIQNSVQFDASIALQDDKMPPRTTLIPENPERLYYHCTKCLRRFETRQGDCIEYENVFDSKCIRLKLQINQEDISMICPSCAFLTKESSSTKRMNRNLESSEPDFVGETGSANLQNKQKFTRQQRFCSLFDICFEEDMKKDKLILYPDTKALCDEFFIEFDNYVLENKLNAKKIYQKLHEIFQNLKRDSSFQLRYKILAKELHVSTLIRSEIKDLAPENLKKRRLEEAQKYFKQQVLIQSDTDSLEKPFVEDSETLLNEPSQNTLPNELLKPKSKSVKIKLNNSKFDILNFFEKYQSLITRYYSQDHENLRINLHCEQDPDLIAEVSFLTNQVAPILCSNETECILNTILCESKFFSKLLSDLSSATIKNP